MAEPTQVQTEPTPVTTAGEAGTPTPVETETAPVSTTAPVEAPNDGAGEVGGGVEGYLAEKERALKGGGTPAPAEAAPAETPPVETPPVAATPPPVETPVVETPVVEIPPEVPPVEEDTPDRIRIKSLPDGHLVAAASEIAKKEKIPFEQAFDRVRPKPPETTAPAPAAPETNGLRSRAVIEADISATREERRAAAAAADKLESGASGKMVDAEEKLEKLKSELGDVEAAEQRAEQDRRNQEETDFVRAVSESKALAVQYWPDAEVAGSEFSNRMLELSDLYMKDPRLAHHATGSDAPFFFAELVAKESGILPVHLQKKGTPPASATPPVPQPSTPPATKPAPVNQRAVLRPVQPAAGPASGAARTTTEAPANDLGIDKIQSVADYEKVKKMVLKKPSQQPVAA